MKLTDTDIAIIRQDIGSYFIENDRNNTSYFDWIFSKGTNFSCYIKYIESLNEEQELENTIDKIRTIVYALHKPLQFTFFYWTILIFVLYRFNFKNKILRIILYHFIFRSLGDVLDKFGDLMPRYYANTIIEGPNNTTYIGCVNSVTAPEMHPLRWVLTRQLGMFLWYTGEICVDWYPLIRTREIVKDAKAIWYVYLTCILFNLSKVVSAFYHLTLSPRDLYDENGVYRKYDVIMFYFKYWVIQLIVIIFSISYDFSVYYVLRKYSFQIENSSVSFVNKFKTFSLYRIRVTAIISAIFLPLITITIFLKFYYYHQYNYVNLEFSFDELRTSIANLQYFIIFIDQILLSYTNTASKNGTTLTKPEDIKKDYIRPNSNPPFDNSKFDFDTMNKNFIKRKSSRLFENSNKNDNPYDLEQFNNMMMVSPKYEYAQSYSSIHKNSEVGLVQSYNSSNNELGLGHSYGSNYNGNEYERLKDQSNDTMNSKTIDEIYSSINNKNPNNDYNNYNYSNMKPTYGSSYNKNNGMNY